LTQEFEVAALREEDRFARDTVQMYQGVRIWMLSHVKQGLKLPKLSTVLPTRDGAKPVRQTPAQMRTMLHVIAAQYGGKLVQVDPVTGRNL
jgi:hypothetical protein